MGSLSLAGRVVNAADLAPLGGVAVRLHGPLSAFGNVPGVRRQHGDRQIVWTRRLMGFAGSRWDCWTAHVQGQVPGITWEQFRDGALTHNPSLNIDHLFKPDQDYVLPEAVPVAPYTWTRQLTSFAGSRWDCWTAHVQGQVPGITWEQFRDGVLLRNPQLNADGRLFRTSKAYLIPELNDAPRAALETITDREGQYHFALGGEPAVCELQIEVDGFTRFVLPLMVNGAIMQPVALTPLPGVVNGVRSARPDYHALPSRIRRIIDQALRMLGDDAQVFDALTPELRRLCYGAQFLYDPNHRHYKDIVCADLLSAVFASAGFNIHWGGAASTHMADYYHPERAKANVIEIFHANDWLPGDVLVYGTGAPASRARHVNLYVGAFTGTDRSGRTYTLSEGADVVEGSMDFLANGREVGTGVIGVNLQRCLQAKRGIFTWVRHVRLREVAAQWSA